MNMSSGVSGQSSLCCIVAIVARKFLLVRKMAFGRPVEPLLITRVAQSSSPPALGSLMSQRLVVRKIFSMVNRSLLRLIILFDSSSITNNFYRKSNKINLEIH